MLANHVDRVLHHALDVGRDDDRLRDEQLDRQRPIPNGPMGRTVLRLKPGGEQRFHLIVGPIDRPGPPDFLVALAAEF